jgi:hypothetical protein
MDEHIVGLDQLMRMEFEARKNNEIFIIARMVQTKHGPVFIQIKNNGLHSQTLKLGNDPSDHRLGRLKSVRFMRSTLRSLIENQAKKENSPNLVEN